MINPLGEPPTRTTTHGATMSDRLSRLYTWLQANGVGLTDFSTDSCVAREMPKLIALRDELDALIQRTGAELGERPVRNLTDLQADLRNIMRRTPANRVTR